MTATANGKASRVLIVDNQAIVRQGFAMILGGQPDLTLCGEATDHAEAFQVYTKCRPDLTIVDITLGEGNGLELIKDLVALDSNAKILMCSMHGESLYAERALRAGAKGYINKSAETVTLLSAMRKILDGQLYLSQHMTDRLLFRLTRNGDFEEKSSLDPLSDRELEVFEEIGHGATTKQIARKFSLSPKTIETYRENLKRKLKLQNAAELTQHAVRWMLENTGMPKASSA